jgi:hypothetical protein
MQSEKKMFTAQEFAEVVKEREEERQLRYKVEDERFDLQQKVADLTMYLWTARAESFVI